MLNGLVEDWFNEGLDVGYQKVVIERRIGLPTVHLEADFRAVSAMGDRVVLSLDVERLGTKSLTLQVACTGRDDGVLRMQAQIVLVTTSLASHQAIGLPVDIRSAITAAQARQPAAG